MCEEHAMDANSTTAIVVYRGVLADEAEIFRFVLSRLPDCRTVTVGTARGQVAGPGGVQVAEATLDELANPDIIAVPGGIGCERQAEIARWLRRASPAWVVSSSTGSALLAAADLLHDASAATHWLAGPLLERYGAHPSDKQLVVDGSIITSSGSVSAFRAALVVAEAFGGAELVARIRADAADARDRTSHPQRQGLWRRFGNTILRRSREPSQHEPLDRALGELDVLDLGQVSPPPPDRH
jgi:transcriptional regulator GlxA family with amidase domain